MCHFQYYFATHLPQGKQCLEHSPLTTFTINKKEQAILEPRKEGNEWIKTLVPPGLHPFNMYFFYSLIAI